MRTDYPLLNTQLEAMLASCPNLISNLANASALIAQSMDRLNWAGFYLMQDGKLILGPFQGKVACTVIPVGKGVCGTAVQKDEIQLVSDVHRFPGHIACDSASNSEIVVPLHKDGNVWGVLDMDSPELYRFTEEDREGLAEFCRILEGSL